MSTAHPPIFLKSALEDHLETVQLERYVTVGDHDVRRRARVPIVGNETEAELVCRAYQEFEDVCRASRLSLGTGVLKYEFWRQCLQGQARSHWDSVVASQVAANSNVHFGEGIRAWFEKYMEPTAFHDQKEYFLQASKAYAMSCKQTASRVKEIISWMLYMPGAPDVAPAYSAVEEKLCFYRLMRPAWKAAFDGSGNTITSEDYTWERLVTYMATQERLDTATRASSSRGRGGDQRGGRRYNNRGRSGGRGNRGRSSSYPDRYSGYRRPSYFQSGPPSQRPRYDSGSSFNPAYQNLQNRGFIRGDGSRISLAGRGYYSRAPNSGRGAYGRSNGGRYGNRGRGSSNGRGRGPHGRGDNYAIEDDVAASAAHEDPTVHPDQPHDAHAIASAWEPPHNAATINMFPNDQYSQEEHWMYQQDQFAVDHDIDDEAYAYGDY